MKGMILLPQQLYEREKILEACLAVFAQHGYKNTSTGILAEAAGISKALIFHHFKSKKKLYFKLLEHCYEKGGKVFQMKNVREYGDFFQAISISMRKKFEYYRKNRYESKLVYEAFYLTPEELKEELAVKYEDVFEEKNHVWEQQFEKVKLQNGIDRHEAMEFIMMTLEQFEKQFLTELTDHGTIDDGYAKNLYDKMDRFCNMIRNGIEITS
jgi:AcrR family transcriptional regulator